MAYTDEPEGDEYICECECPHTCRCEQEPCMCQCDCADRHEAEHHATALFLEYMTQYAVWDDPMQGAVSPALGEFFRFCNPTLPALVHWARWLLIKHECNPITVPRLLTYIVDEPVFVGETIDSFFIDEDRAEELVGAMIRSQKVDHHLADQMRRALHEGYGERDPDQLELF